MQKIKQWLQFSENLTTIGHQTADKQLPKSHWSDCAVSINIKIVARCHHCMFKDGGGCLQTSDFPEEAILDRYPPRLLFP